MRPGDKAALEALNLRFAHVECTARLLARCHEERELNNVLHGIADTLGELSDRLDGIINPSSS